MARKAKAVPEVRDESQKKYLARRDARIEQLFLREGYEPRDIADAMLDARQRPDKVGHAASVMRTALVKINLMEEVKSFWTKIHPIIIPALNEAEAAGIQEIKEEAGQ